MSTDRADPLDTTASGPPTPRSCRRAMRVARHPAVVLACRLIIGATFVYASIDKVLHPDAFAALVANYDMMPLVFLNAFAVLLPMTELVVGLLLILGGMTRAAAIVCAGMLLMFIAAVGLAMAAGGDFECGCFSTEGGSSVGWPLLVRNTLMVVGCALIALGAPGWLALHSTTFGGNLCLQARGADA